nr:MAG TPA: tyrosinase [Caudoviricetes sp.]
MYVEYKDNKYFTTNICKMKQADGTWINAIVYQSSKDGNFYARELIDFLAKFKPQDDPVNIFHFAISAKLNVEYKGKRYRVLGYNYETNTGILADNNDKVVLVEFNQNVSLDDLKIVY